MTGWPDILQVDQVGQEKGHPWVESKDFVSVQVLDLLQLADAQKKSSPQRSGAPWAWVFDLDSTLFCTGDRSRRVLFEFLRSQAAPRLWWLAYEHFSSGRQRYSLEKTFAQIFESEVDERSAGVAAAQLWEAFKPYWEKEFFSSRFIWQDHAFRGAAEFVNQVAHKGAEIVYLTARDRPRSGEATWSSLRRAGFPCGNQAHLFMKSAVGESDLEFKRKAASVVGARFNVGLSLDNEPENLVMFARAWPQAEIVFFSSVMSDRIPTQALPQLLGARRPLRLASFVQEI